MAFDNTVTIVGNITRDPELRFTPGGSAVANFGLAWNKRNKDGEDTACFFDITAWNQLAENVSESLSKGMRVVVYGRLDHRTWQTNEGDKRSKVEIIADEIAPSLRWATAEVTRNERTDFQGGAPAPSGGGRPEQAEPSDQGKAYDPSEEPF